MLTGKGILRTGYGSKKGKEILRSGYGSKDLRSKKQFLFHLIL